MEIQLAVGVFKSLQGLTAQVDNQALDYTTRFVGFDNHHASIERERELAKEEGLSADQISFEVYSATDFPLYSQNNEKYDLIAFFDCLHDMGDPVGGISHALQSIKPDGTAMIVEPFANDQLLRWHVCPVRWLSAAHLCEHKLEN